MQLSPPVAFKVGGRAAVFFWPQLKQAAVYGCRTRQDRCRSGEVELQSANFRGIRACNCRAQLFAELARLWRWRWPTACLKHRWGMAKPGHIRALLRAAPYVRTMHRRPHQHARRMIEPVRACVRARTRVLCAVCCVLWLCAARARALQVVFTARRCWRALTSWPVLLPEMRLTPRFAPSTQAQ
jgi:hypothetical protein